MAISHAESILKLLINDERRSDCCFIVGSEKNKIYASKNLLAAVSPVFESMFFGDMKEDTSKPIEVPDICHRGFMNMIKFIYGFRIEELDLSGLIDTYIVADKYLFKRLIDDLTMYMAKCIDAENCLINFDQMLRLQKISVSPDGYESMMSDVVNFIQKNCEDALKSEWLTKINKDTLIEILKMDHLHVDELDIILAIVKWIDAELVRKGIESNEENKLEELQSFKHLIRFTDLKYEDVYSISELLSKKELCSIFNYLRDGTNNSLDIEYAGTRRRGNSQPPTFNSLDMSRDIRACYQRFDSLSFYLKADYPVYLHSIDTLLSDDLENLILQVYLDDDLCPLKITRVVVDHKFKFEFSNDSGFFQMLPNKCYKFTFQFNLVYFGSDDELAAFETFFTSISEKSKAYRVEYPHRRFLVEFTISPCNNIHHKYHCLRRLNFSYL